MKRNLILAILMGCLIGMLTSCVSEQTRIKRDIERMANIS